MVLGLRTKSRKGPSVNVDYLVHVQEIKPCPPSHSLKSLRSVLLQWENGDRSSGSTNTVVPSLGSIVGGGKIEFNESFRIPVTLYKEPSIKGGNVDTFEKNCLEFNLYEVRSNKTVKGQLLGTVVIDLAEYGVLKETVTVSVPMNCKRSIRNAAQPLLFLKLEPFHKRSSRSSSRDSLSKEASLDKNGAESISSLMNEDYDEEAEIASFTDDDDDNMSQHSSLTVSSSAFEATEALPPQSEENAFEPAEDSTGRAKNVPHLPIKAGGTKPNVHPATTAQGPVRELSSHSTSSDSSSLVGSPEIDRASFSSIKGKPVKVHPVRSATHSVQSSSSSIAYEEDDATCNGNSRSVDPKHMVQEVHGKIVDGRSAIKGDAELPLKEKETGNAETKILFADIETPMDDIQPPVTSADPHVNEVDAKEVRGQNRVVANEASDIKGSHTSPQEFRGEKKHIGNGHTEKPEADENPAAEVEERYSLNAMRKSGEGVGNATSSMRDPEVKINMQNGIKLKHVKSVRSLLEAGRSKRFESNNQLNVESREANSLEGTKSSDISYMHGIKDAVALSSQAKHSLSDSKLQQLEYRIERLETELREAAALEVSLYSIVAEHGSSANKVHAPARRLSRLYFHARKWSKPRGASAARSVVSGLVLVAKACGNDVPRLTFWLSNSIVLRAIIGSTLGDSQLPVSAGPLVKNHGGEKRKDKGSSLLKWEEFPSRNNQNKLGFAENVDEWEESYTFTSALEKIEAWIFSRIIESVWWQTLTPHMQSANPSEEKITSSLRNSYGRKPCLSEYEQTNFSVELWKKAFKDACERLCPVRAAGHECGCLRVLARLVMEQCVNRLDVAMFNAILRESADDIPTDPVSDPISDSKVLPIAAGKSSFGAGAQLKNAIGNWSRWLTDLFGIDDDDSHEVQNDLNLDEDEIPESDASSKSFHLLNALSDLMMLPKDMLLSSSIRKEVCPTFGAPLIKRILSDFSPDEFCPDPIPEEVFQALDVEVPFDDEKDSISYCPCSASAIGYSPPSAALIATSILGESGESHLRRSGSSVLRKSYTSDDELDDLDSPLASITNSFKSTSSPSQRAMENRGRNVVRYGLLQEVWRDGD